MRPACVRLCKSSDCPGFTLVELLIVVVVLAIIAGIAVPQINGERAEATVSALMANVNLVSMMLDFHRHKSQDDSWPPEIASEWFTSRRFPFHPDRPEGVPQVETVSSPGKLHPADKVLASGSAGAYWYNAANGSFRARVRSVGRPAATLDTYNRVNQSSLTSLSETGKSKVASTPATPGPLSLGR